MLRSFLVGVLSVTALASCTGKEGGPAVQAGVSAGKVVELSGTVTAKRGTESRPLASGTDVSGDDVIETGADSSVSIVLAHNNATWSLGPNKREKVADSLAWSLAKVDKPAAGAVESTSAAGRHAEKTGANSSATAQAADNAKAEEPAAEPEPQRTAPGATPPRPTTAPAAQPAVAAEPSGGAPNTAVAPPAPSPASTPRPDVATPPPAPRSATSKSAKGGGAAASLDRSLETGTPPPLAAIDTNKRNASELQRLALGESRRLRACLPASMSSLSVVLVVTDGKALVQVPAGTPTAVKSCLDGVVATLKPSAGLTDKLTLTLTRQ